MPLSHRPGLMCAYTGDVKDPQCHCQICLTNKAINDMTKTLLGESLESCSKVGLNPFCTLNKPPVVSIFEPFSLTHCLSLYLLIITLFLQVDSPFWNKKKKTAVAKTKTGPRQKKNKIAIVIKLAAAGESSDADESEVELESLGRLFMELADASCS